MKKFMDLEKERNEKLQKYQRREKLYVAVIVLLLLFYLVVVCV